MDVGGIGPMELLTTFACVVLPCLVVIVGAIGAFVYWTRRRNPAPRPPASADEIDAVIEHQQGRPVDENAGLQPPAVDDRGDPRQDQPPHL